jgi:predicted DNA-binding protein (UPF0251 family)
MSTLTTLTENNTKMPSVLIAYDGSGSTGGANFYHLRTQEIIAQYPDAQLLLWDTSPRVVSRAELVTINAEKKGYGGTDSSAIARYVESQGFHGHLVIITDGQVHTDSIDRCALSLGGSWPFTQVTAHLIETGGIVNMSVTCPFTRVAPHAVYCYRLATSYEPTQEVSVSAADLEAVRLIDTVTSTTDYEAAADAIERAVIARTMGTTGEPSLRDAILAMKKRMVAEQARVFGDSEAVTALTEALEAGRTDDALMAANVIHNEYYSEERGWSARISRLIAMCEGALRGAFDLTAVNSAFHSDRVRRAAVVAPVAIPVSAEAVPENEHLPPFVCPITLDGASDIILLIADGKPILEGLEKSVITDILDCPLNLFHYPEVVATLCDRLDHPISLTAYREAATAGAPILTGPMTRRPLLAGGICLGCSEDHCSATTWTLAQLTTGSKLVGNPDLWFACLWLLLHRGQAGEHLSDLEPHFAINMRWRLQNHTTFISLTGLPEFPSTRVPLGAAIWYVFASSRFTGSEPRRDLIRTHMPHIKELVDILSGCLSDAYTLPEGVPAHVRRVRVMLSMLSWVKRDRRTLHETLRGLTQNSVIGPIASMVELEFCEREHMPVLIPLDGPPLAARLAEVRASLPSLWTQLGDNELMGLADLVDPSKSAGDILLPFDWAPPLHQPSLHNWVYGLDSAPTHRVRICAATCRPFYIVPETGEPWPVVAERIYGVAPTKMISLDKQFGVFVTKYERYPNPAEFLVFLYNRYIHYGNHQTLPAQLSQLIGETFDEFSEIMRMVIPAEFVRRFTESTTSAKRIEMEAAEAQAVRYSESKCLITD